MFQGVTWRYDRPRRGLNRAGRGEAIWMTRNIAALAFVVLGVMTLTPATAEEAVSDDAGTIRTELITSLPVDELWHSLNPVAYRSGDPSVSYWQADRENEPWDGDWRSPGFVLLGNGDIAVVPIAIRIWTKSDDRFLEALSRKETEEGRDAVALFGPTEDNVRLRIIQNSNGEVLVDGKLVGKISYGD